MYADFLETLQSLCFVLIPANSFQLLSSHQLFARARIGYSREK